MNELKIPQTKKYKSYFLRDISSFLFLAASILGLSVFKLVVTERKGSFNNSSAESLSCGLKTKALSRKD